MEAKGQVDRLRQRNAPQNQPEGQLLTSASSRTQYASPGPTFSWTRPSTWSASMKLAPIPIVLLSIYIYVYARHFQEVSRSQVSDRQLCQSEFDVNIPIAAVIAQLKQLASSSWDHGIAADALLEYAHPNMTVFGEVPFPADKVPSSSTPLPEPLSWVQSRISVDNAEVLGQEAENESDSAALGVSAILLGQIWPKYLIAATRYRDHLLSDAKHLSPPFYETPSFLAVYAIVSNDLELLAGVVRQCKLHRSVLRIIQGNYQVTWKYATTDETTTEDSPVLSSAVGRSAYSMARVHATLKGWRPSKVRLSQGAQDIEQYIREIIDGAIRTAGGDSGLLNEHLSEHGGLEEISGTALLAATIYRMAVLNPGSFATKDYLEWANDKRAKVMSFVNSDGLAVAPVKHKPGERGKASVGAQSSVLLLSAAWRDCVCRHVCK